ncbi:hypothetical protein RND71_000618 [Anisodus tanguticus]|uniref:Uncharacterized protein n=1 Tax=Anisodus tanguticus TaxID=243964 RepID=A0AAE1T1J0_9SOLA|nr:hypothetical protein RND71_000618 [Anisodus tanguticus]
MGSADDDNLLRKQTHKSINDQTKYKLKLLCTINDSFSSDSNSLLNELNVTKKQLETSRSQIIVLNQQLKSTSQLVNELLAQLNILNQSINRTNDSTLLNFNDLLDDLSNEAKLALGPHKLPLGYASVGGGCLSYKEDLAQYMTYRVGKECHVDDVFAQRLMLKGCEPLPRRRCHPKAPFREKQRWQFDNGGLDFGMGEGLDIDACWCLSEASFLREYSGYRVLRPGGLFRLDHFFCMGSQLNVTYVPMLERVGFTKLRWNDGMKLDRGIDKNEW